MLYGVCLQSMNAFTSENRYANGTLSCNYLRMTMMWYFVAMRGFFSMMKIILHLVAYCLLSWSKTNRRLSWIFCSIVHKIHVFHGQFAIVLVICIWIICDIIWYNNAYLDFQLAKKIPSEEVIIKHQAMTHISKRLNYLAENKNMIIRSNCLEITFRSYGKTMLLS